MRARTHAPGEFAAHGVCGAAFESLNELRDRHGGWVSDEQVDVVGLAVELDEFGIEVGADLIHGGLGSR